MASVHRQGDPNTAGGIAISGVSSVRINNRPVVVNGTPVSPHPCCGQKRCPPIHCYAVTANGITSVKAAGIPINVTGNSDTCGHPRAAGSNNVSIG